MSEFINVSKACLTNREASWSLSRDSPRTEEDMAESTALALDFSLESQSARCDCPRRGMCFLTRMTPWRGKISSNS